MKLAKLRLQNFRCFLDRTVTFGGYACLVGPGGAGKSTILTALRIFFRDTTGSATDLLTLHEEDFFGKDTSRDIIITVTFSDLDVEAQEDFKHYFRQGRLVVSAVAKWNEQFRSAEVKQYGQRMVMTAFAEFFRAEGDGAAVSELRQAYSTIRTAHPDLSTATTKTAMVEALRAYEASHPEACELQTSADEFYGFSKGSNRLQKYIQWVFVPAVKDASTEQLEAKKTALGVLLERTVRSKMSFSEPLATLRADVEKRYQELLDENQNALEELSKSLGARLQEWAHPAAKLTLAWRSDPTKYISITEPLAEVLAGDGRFQGNLARSGHGLQRSFLLALLQELSGCGDTGNPRLLFTCEEPELYQHPPQSRHLSSVLQKLSKTNTQVVVTSHSPYFISGQGFEDVRVIRQELAENQPCVRSATFEELSQKLAEAFGEQVPLPTGMEFKVEQSLQVALNEMFFSPVLILVEGLEDLGFISTQFTLTDRMDEFRRLGCHIVPTSGKGSMIQPLAIARILEIPTFVVFDADGDSANPDRRAQHKRDNLALLRLCGVATPTAFPNAIFQTPNLLMWPTKIGLVIKEEFGAGEWERYAAAVRQKRKIADVPGLNKKMLFIGQVLTEAYQDGRKSSLLSRLCDQIISFARGVRANLPSSPSVVSEAGS
jgi:putative ATP-dependent endonuclease of OLD family